LGQIQLLPDRFRFTNTADAGRGSEAEVFDFPLDGLHCTLTGFDNSSLLFAHPSQPETQLVVDHPDFLHHPHLQSHPAIAAARSLRNQRLRRFKLAAGCILIAVLALLLTLLLAGGLALGWARDRWAIQGGGPESSPVDLFLDPLQDSTYAAAAFTN
jgi:hypothetical protein